MMIHPQNERGISMKKISTMIAIAAGVALTLSGCMIESGRGSLVETSLTLRNSTGYDIESFALQFMGSTGIKRINPMESPVESGTSLKSGEKRTFTFSIGKNEVPEPWSVNMRIAEVENTCHSIGTISLDGVESYEITFDGLSGEDDLRFTFAALGDDAESDGADVINWWGKYNSVNYVLGITNYDGNSFLFTIGDEETGVAAIDPDNPYAAEFGEMTFVFDGEDTIQITGGDYAETYFRSQN
jgi:hypothetical protein